MPACRDMSRGESKISSTSTGGSLRGSLVYFGCDLQAEHR